MKEKDSTRVGTRIRSRCERVWTRLIRATTALCALIATAPVAGHAAEAQAASRELRVVGSVFHQAVGVPGAAGWGIARTRLHPGAMLGAELSCLDKGRWRLVQGAYLGYFLHLGFHSGAFAGTESSLGVGLPWRTHLDGSMGVGVAWSHLGSGGYCHRGSAGLKPCGGSGRLHALATMSVGLRHSLPERWGIPMDVFARYQSFNEITFSRYAPMLPRTLLHLGVSVPVARVSIGRGSSR